MSVMKTTPLIEQYLTIKAKYSHALLLFQVGDFYELFFNDALQASQFLGIALTQRGTYNGLPIPLCGVPIHALDHYLAKLIKGSFSVALCDQLEQPQPGQIVKRGVTQVLTPGTLTDAKLLDEKSASYICSFFSDETNISLLFAELLTANMYGTSIDSHDYKLLEVELNRFFPDEIIINKEFANHNHINISKKQGYHISQTDSIEDPTAWINQQFQNTLFKKISSHRTMMGAIQSLYSYLKNTNEQSLETFHNINFYESDDFLILDATTQKNLELTYNLNNHTRTNSLLNIIDKTSTPCGARTLKKWIVRPLVKKTAIEQRLDVVSFFKSNPSHMIYIKKLLLELGDFERVIGKIALGKGQIYDYLHLIKLLKTIPLIKQYLINLSNNVPPLLSSHTQSLYTCTSLYELFEKALNNDQSCEWLIKYGFHKQLDELRDTIKNTDQQILNFETNEKIKNNISSLKIGYTSVFGYFIEITNIHAHRVPENYKRQQTLSGRERYTCSELREFENIITKTHTAIKHTEKEIFDDIKNQTAQFITPLRNTSYALSQIDALLSLATCAYEYNYVRPFFNENNIINIIAGKHPVVAITHENTFIPNDTIINKKQLTLIITGPNMGGKSTYLRQTALIAIMAQCGSFVPAKEANMPIFDKIFTRLGTSDNVAEGKSTFLVEMEETAYICNKATNKSLIILDEIGRGTSTFDGLAIAQSVVEYIHKNIQAACMFATHYHELTLLENKIPGIINMYAESIKNANGIILLHTIIPGIARGSFGIDIAQFAGLPHEIIERAYIIAHNYNNSSS